MLITLLVKATATGAKLTEFSYQLDDSLPMFRFVQDIASMAGFKDYPVGKTTPNADIGEPKQKLQVDADGSVTPDTDIDLAKPASKQGVCNERVVFLVDA